MKTDRIVIVQCRLSSSRLPGKALLKLGDKTVLDWVLAAMHKVHADYYYVATDEASYEKILPVCERNNFNCFKGSLSDVLKRFVDLLNTVKVNTVIRATADNPFLFYEAAEESVIEFEEKNKKGQRCDYLTYSGLPHGCGVEIFRADSLKKGAEQTVDSYDHEHVGPTLYNHRDVFNCDFVPAPIKYKFPELRATIDTYSDYLRAAAVVQYLGLQETPYTYQKILEALNSKQVKNPLIFVPSVVKGHGTGHLHRCLSAATKSGAFVYIPKNSTLIESDLVIRSYIEKGLNPNQIISRMPDESYLPVIVTDAFKLTKEQYEEIKINKILISLDESSDLASYSDYLLDIIPSYKLNRKPNLIDAGLIEKPQNVKTSPLTKDSPVKKVLICLGGEDPAGLTLPAVKMVEKCLLDSKITAVCKQPENFSFGNVEFSTAIKDLKEKIYEYDLVITHYGLTAFEATCAGCKVILLPTTKLHAHLAKKYGYAYISSNNFTQTAFQNALESKNILPSALKFTSEKDLNTVLSEISNGKKMVCPVCAKSSAFPNPIISRNKTRTYRRCKECGMVYMSFTCEKEKEYHKAYFFEDYKKQYGRTYEEDFESIKKQGKRRLANIRSVCSRLADKNIFDIGCAYGPFLSAAADEGLNPFGTDISYEAINYVQETLRIPAVYSTFPDINTEGEFGISQFDIVTMWYVIEHFKDLDSVLRKVSDILKPNGIFAFSTPSGEGVSAKTNRDLFYQNSPTDHFTIWEPGRCENILKKYGLKVEKIVSTGHHPERFPIIQKRKASKGSLLWYIVDAYSKSMQLGDTVEIYCRKI